MANFALKGPYLVATSLYSLNDLNELPALNKAVLALVVATLLGIDTEAMVATEGIALVTVRETLAE